MAVKRVVYIIEGCGPDAVLGSVEGILGRRNVYLEGGGGWVDAVVEDWGWEEGCRRVRVGFSGRRMWGEFFLICARRRGGEVVIVVERRGGVGRLSASIVGGWLMEEVYRRCPGLIQVL